MLIALEGSSPTINGENNRKYYVWQAYQLTTQPLKIYKEGPAALSFEGSAINIRKMADAATAFIKASAVSDKVFLVGWSRGAAACIQVAHDLKRSGAARVDAMFLFDAVDQDTSTNSDLNFIPDSVVNVYHAIATKKDWKDKIIFPTCGTVAAQGVNLFAQNFNATHGGIAGSGDDAGSRDWMWTRMKEEGVL
jgi:pimeloyl-ACP methyl ester carboxylesterase